MSLSTQPVGDVVWSRGAGVVDVEEYQGGGGDLPDLISDGDPNKSRSGIDDVYMNCHPVAADPPSGERAGTGVRHRRWAWRSPPDAGGPR